MPRPGWPPTGWRPRPVPAPCTMCPRRPTMSASRRCWSARRWPPARRRGVRADRRRAMVEDVRALRRGRHPGRRLHQPHGGPVVTFVGSDDVAVGYSAARALIEGLGGKGDIVAIEGTAGAPTARDRTVGLQPGPGRGAGDRVCWAPASAPSRWRRRGWRWPGCWPSIRASTACGPRNDLMAFGALEALAEAGRSAKVVGINGLPGAIDHIEQRHDAGQRRFQRLQHRRHRRPRRPAPSRRRGRADSRS